MKMFKNKESKGKWIFRQVDDRVRKTHKEAGEALGKFSEPPLPKNSLDNVINYDK